MIDDADTSRFIPSETDRLRACLEIGKLLTSARDLDEILELILKKGSDLIDAENWSLLLRDRVTGELTFEVVVGIDSETVYGIKIDRGVGIAGHVAESGIPLIIPDVKGDSRFNPDIDSKTGFITSSIVCIPLKIRGSVLGVVEVVNPGDMDEFKMRDLPFMLILSDYAAIAIENAQYMAEINRLAITDEYTGLFNARYLHRTMDRLTKEYKESGDPFSVVFVDIDDFKTVVDTHGHLLGSHVLKEIGETIQAHLEPNDIVIKYGGDEYVLVLPDTDKQAAQKRIRPILQAIASTSYLSFLPEPVHVTASFGLAVFPEDADSKREILIAADNLMYSVKRTGKNAIGIAET